MEPSTFDLELQLRADGNGDDLIWFLPWDPCTTKQKRINGNAMYRLSADLFCYEILFSYVLNESTGKYIKARWYSFYTDTSQEELVDDTGDTQLLFNQPHSTIIILSTIILNNTTL